MLEKGEGVKKDISLAFKYLKMSANSDYAQAQAGLGFKYLFGNPELGIEVDYNLAKKWILLAAEKNNAWAYSMLSHIYRWGKGTNIDLDKALAYANLAVKNEYDKSINLDYLKKLVVNIKEDLKNEESFLEKSKNLENDKDPPIFKIINQKDNSSELVTLEGELEDKSNIAILLIDGTPIEISKNGFFKSELYVPKNGIEIRLEAIDQFGNKADKNIRLVRKEIIKKNSSKFSKLNPSKVNTSLNENDLALIIGITEYENIKPSIYARKDARFFYDYMQNILGVPSNRIKLLIGEEARRTDITLAYKNWVRGRINNQSNVYIFFSGNGLASADGKKLYLMPYDVYPSLLDDTAIGRDEIITSIQEVTPKSVYFFIDASYSGQTREKEMILTDARPITIVPIESDVPENFTVFSASSGSEISGSLPEADHGLFSYFLMKGLEGNADANNDKKITNGELHSYVRSNVTKQAVRLEREQTPQLQGDENRVLVEFY